MTTFEEPLDDHCYLTAPESQVVAGTHTPWIFEDLDAFMEWVKVMWPKDVLGPKDELLPACWSMHPRIVQLGTWAWAALEHAAAQDSTTDEHDIPNGGAALAAWWTHTGKPIMADLHGPRSPCDHGAFISVFSTGDDDTTTGTRL